MPAGGTRPNPHRRTRRERLGRPTLTTADAVGQALAVGPIQGAGFVLFLIAGTAGAATPLVLVLALVGTLSLGWVISLYARRHAGVGAIYEYVTREQGAALGIAAAGAYYLSLLVITMGGAAASTLLWQGFFDRQLGFDPGFWITGLALFLLAGVLIYLGVRLSVRVQLALTVLSAIPFLVLVVAVVAGDGAQETRSVSSIPSVGSLGTSSRLSCSRCSCSPGSRWPGSWERRPACHTDRSLEPCC